MPHMFEASGNSHLFLPISLRNCTTLREGYWAVLGSYLRTVEPKRRPGARDAARLQPGLCQGGGIVGYKSACHLLETGTRFCAL